MIFFNANSNAKPINAPGGKIASSRLLSLWKNSIRINAAQLPNKFSMPSNNVPLPIASRRPPNATKPHNIPNPMEKPSKAEWAVKKDGGKFDQFAGATITPRAVVNQVKRAALAMLDNLPKEKE